MVAARAATVDVLADVAVVDGGRFPSKARATKSRDKQADLLLSCGRGAMIEALHPLLVFSRVFLTMMRLSLLSSLSALAAKMGAGGKKRPPGGEGHSRNRRVPPPPPPPPRLQGLRQQGRA